MTTLTDGSAAWRRLARGTRGFGAAALVAACAWLAPSSAAFAAEAVPACPAGTSLLPHLRADGRLAKVEAEAATVPHNTGRFFRIEKEGLAPSFLFGTMHLSDPRIVDLPKAVNAARKEAGTVVVETLDALDKQAAIRGLLSRPDLFVLPAGETLDDYLTPTEKREAETLLNKRGVPYAAIRTLQPWFFSIGMMLPDCEVARAAAGAVPLDTMIVKDAERDGKTIVGLETAEEQMRSLASMPLRLQSTSLLAVLRMHEQLSDHFETVTELYLDGRIAAVTLVAERLVPDEAIRVQARTTFRGEYRDFKRAKRSERNHRMAERLAPRLAEGGVFVAVGAAHLPDVEGLVELIGRQGFRLSRAD